MIGERLGVSRQAARQRYAERVEQTPPTVGLIRGRDLDSALTAALEAAQAEGLAEAGAEHLLRGLLIDGVAAATRDKVREVSRRLFDYPDALASPPHAVFSPKPRRPWPPPNSWPPNAPRPAPRWSPPHPSCWPSSPPIPAPVAAAS
ncbi:hypothetical protein ACFQ0G_10995 [Streptomyces chiangmaiensis]